MQITERVNITVINETTFSEPTPLQLVNNTQLDLLLFLNCPTTLNPSGKCLAYRDVAQFLPGTRTRLRFKTGAKPGLFVWHW